MALTRPGPVSVTTAAQARLTAALQDWLWRSGGQALADQLAAFSEGAELADLPLLHQLFDPASDRAEQLVADLVAVVSAQLALASGLTLPLSHALCPESASLVLLRRGQATVAVQALACGTYPVPGEVIFAPLDSHERLIQGTGEAVLVQAGSPPGSADPSMQGPLVQHLRRLQAGDCLQRDGRAEGLVITKVDQALLVLKLQRPAADHAPACAVDLQTGALLRQAASRSADTRLELAAAVLHALERCDAAPALAEAALRPGGVAARWQALRHSLALDSAVGLAALERLAAQERDPLHAPARRLRCQLAETWPGLAEAARCP